MIWTFALKKWDFDISMWKNETFLWLICNIRGKAITLSQKQMKSFKSEEEIRNMWPTGLRFLIKYPLQESPTIFLKKKPSTLKG